jgi:hypothetical protein
MSEQEKQGVYAIVKVPVVRTEFRRVYLDPILETYDPEDPDWVRRQAIFLAGGGISSYTVEDRGISSAESDMHRDHWEVELEDPNDH